MERIPCARRRLDRARLCRLAGWALVWAAGLAGENVLTAAEPGATPSAVPRVHSEAFEGAKAICRVSASPANSNARIRGHERNTRIVHSGQGAELVWVEAAAAGTELFIELDIPPALVFDELTARLWVRPSRPGARLGFRVVFPKQIDPRTGQPLTADFFGEACVDVHRWQELRCRTSDEELRKLLTRVRAQLSRVLKSPEINTQGMYVDRMVLMQELDPGSFEYYLDDLQVGPVIDPRSNGSTLVSPSVEKEAAAPMTVGNNQLLRNGRPFFPLIIPYHGESVDAIRRTVSNIVWTQSYEDASLQEALAAGGLGVMTMPPASAVVAAAEEGSGQATPVAYSVGIPKIPSDSANVLMWNVGSMLTQDDLRDVRATAQAVRDADPYRRPFFADVIENEREFHRSVDVLSYSKHTLHTSTPPAEYARFLSVKNLQALRGRPTMTWIQTETSPANLENRPPEAIVPVVEPEQIWMQVYAALGTGAKGIGYWKQTPLPASNETAAPGAEERLHAITLANIQIHLLHRWLATGKITSLAPVQIGDGPKHGAGILGNSLLTRWNRRADQPPSHPAAVEIQAPVLQCPSGWLILPHYLEHDAQHQPGAMAVQDLRILLRGVEAFQAWEVTTTGIHPYQLRLTHGNGGTEIHLQRFDQFAAILVTNDAAVLDDLKRETQRVRELAATSWVELAARKLDRVQTIHDELCQLGAPAVPHADTVLAEARRDVTAARARLNEQDYDSARLTAQRVLRLTRQIQRTHWENATAKVASPVSTPYSICFQTLPDFYRLLSAVDHAPVVAQSLLRGGDFEDWSTLQALHWTWDVAPSNDTVRVSVALNPSGVSGRALQLAAQAVDPQQRPAIVTDTPVRFISPPMPVFSGQVARIRGKLWIDSPITSHPDGLMVYDNLAGTVAALRWRDDAPTREWIPFELIRPIQRSGDLQLTIELRGLGDVRFDELEVSTLNPQMASRGGE